MTFIAQPTNFVNQNVPVSERNLMDALEHEPPQPRERRPAIYVRAGQLDVAATAAERAVIDAGLPVFQRGGELVRPTTREVSTGGGRVALAAGVQVVTLPGLIDVLSQVATWWKFEGRARQDVQTDPPARVAEILLARRDGWHFLPRLAGVITTPTLRPDGSVLATPGYDATTRLFLMPAPGLVLPAMPARPTREDARAALAKLDALLDGFPFVSNADRAVALAALLTPVVRGAVETAPLSAVRASTAGTGKSFLVDLASVIATGRPCPVISAGVTEEETEKRIAGLLLDASPIASIDNVNGELGGDLLCQALTQPTIRVRRLGGSDLTEIECRATLFATGNNIRVRGDMVRRTLVCSLDAGVERPELRAFGTDPVDTVLSDRGAYVAAAVTVVRAFMLSGAPRLRPLGSFRAWSDTVRSALVWLGSADPCETMETAREEDPELEQLRAFTAAWRRVIPATEQPTVRRLIAEATASGYGVGTDGEYNNPDLYDAIMAVAGDRSGLSPRRLGNWLRARQGRVVDGHRFTRAGEHRIEGVRWRLERVQS